MGPGGAFDGFEEGPIDFPPTFKYDVVRLHKHSKRNKTKQIPQEVSTENLLDSNTPEPVHDDDDDLEQEPEMDGVSLMSSMMTSTPSRFTMDDYTEPDDEDGSLMPQKSAMSSGNVADKMWAATAAHKAKTKWKNFLAAAVPHSAVQKQSKRRSLGESLASKSKTADANRIGGTESSPTPLESTVDGHAVHRSSPSAKSEEGNPLGSPAPDQDVGTIDPEDKGVYDSSPKQRVPSWSVHVVLNDAYLIFLSIGVIAFCGKQRSFRSLGRSLRPHHTYPSVTLSCTCSKLYALSLCVHGKIQSTRPFRSMDLDYRYLIRRGYLTSNLDAMNWSIYPSILMGHHAYV